VECTCIALYSCAVHGTTGYGAQSAGRRQRERTLTESEMVTCGRVGGVVGNGCVRHRADRQDSGATVLLIATHSLLHLKSDFISFTKLQI